MVQKTIDRASYNINYNTGPNEGEWPGRRPTSSSDSNGDFPDEKRQILSPAQDHSKILPIKIKEKKYDFFCEIMIGLGLTVTSFYMSRKKNDSVRLFSLLLGIEVASNAVQISILFFQKHRIFCNEPGAADFEKINLCLSTSKDLIKNNYQNLLMKHWIWIPVFTLAPALSVDFTKKHKWIIVTTYAIQSAIQVFSLMNIDFLSENSILKNKIHIHFANSENLTKISTVMITFIRFIPC